VPYYGTAPNYSNGDIPTIVIDATANLEAINNAFRFMLMAANCCLWIYKKLISVPVIPNFTKEKAR
jgi:hypothetical protein